MGDFSGKKLIKISITGWRLMAVKSTEQKLENIGLVKKKRNIIKK